ncbi:hypothetical protein SANTM175S_06528 [Streptomyces antimycoticus]
MAELPEVPGATAALADALGDPDPTVRRQAALALGRRGVTAAVPTLSVGVRVVGSNDVDAAEILGTLSQDPGVDRIMTALVDELAAPPRTPRPDPPGPGAGRAVGTAAEGPRANCTTTTTARSPSSASSSSDFSKSGGGAVTNRGGPSCPFYGQSLCGGTHEC